MTSQRIFGIKQVNPINRNDPISSALSIEDLYEVIDDILNLDDSDMQRVQLYSQEAHRIDVTVVSNYVFQYVVEPHLDRSYQLRSGRAITIVKPFEEFKVVRVRRIPGIWDESDLRRIFNHYGTVKSVEEEFMRPNSYNKIRDSWRHLSTGTFRIKMKMVRSSFASTPLS